MNVFKESSVYYCNDFGGPNYSRKPQPTPTKLGAHTQVKGDYDPKMLGAISPARGGGQNGGLGCVPCRCILLAKSDDVFRQIPFG